MKIFLILLCLLLMVIIFHLSVLYIHAKFQVLEEGVITGFTIFICVISFILIMSFILILDKVLS